MKERHVCPKCHQATGWHGPSKLSKSKLRAILFYIWHRSPCFSDCNNCGHTISAKEWTQLQRVPEKPLEFETPSKPTKAIHQDISKFMKHGHQASWYRKSVKERKQPEED